MSWLLVAAALRGVWWPSTAGRFVSTGFAPCSAPAFLAFLLLIRGQGSSLRPPRVSGFWRPGWLRRYGRFVCVFVCVMVMMVNFTSKPRPRRAFGKRPPAPRKPKRKTRPAIRRSARWRETLRAGVRRAIIGERTNSDRRRRRDEEQRTRRKNAGPSGIMPGLWVAKPHADSAPCTCASEGSCCATHCVGGGATQAPAREAAR